jgi:RNA polymerase sigma factor (sigma-70 family)
MMSDDKFTQQLFDNQAIIHKVCRVYIDDPDDRADLFQEVLYQVFKSKNNFRAESKLTTWLYQIALNTAITFFKKEKKRTLAEQGFQQENQTNDDENEQMYNEKYAALYTGIETLSKIDKALIMLYLDDISYQEISKMMGISENNVAVKINRIKAKLKMVIG